MSITWLFLRLKPRQLHFIPGDQHIKHKFENCPCEPTADPKDPSMITHHILVENEAEA